MPNFFDRIKGLAPRRLVGLQTIPNVVVPTPVIRPPVTFDRSRIMHDTQYVKEERKKNLIVLHHTVGGSAISTLNFWLKDPRRVGTAFIIDRDGTVYVAFEPQFYAWHLGEGASGPNAVNEERSIGIELASEGALQMVDGTVVTMFQNPQTKRYRAATDPHVDLGKVWRDYRYFDAYDEPQVQSCFWLVDALCKRFEIPRRVPKDKENYRADLRDFKGIIGHAHVRSDKSDVHPKFPWGRLVRQLKLEEVA